MVTEERMEEIKRESVVMEGMYRGMTGKLEEVRQSLGRELQAGAAQQMSVYESLAATLREGMDAILNEVKYLAQQNSSIYESDRKEFTKLRESVIEQVRASAESSVQVFGDTIRETEEKLSARIDDLRDELLELLGAEHPERKDGEAAAENAEKFDYDDLAEHVAAALPETDYDLIAERVVAALPVQSEDALAEKVALSVPAVDYDRIAERVASVMEHEFDVTVDEQGITRIAQAVAETLDYDALAERVAALLAARLPVQEVAQEMTEEQEPVAEETPEAEVQPEEEAPEEVPAAEGEAPETEEAEPIEEASEQTDEAETPESEADAEPSESEDDSELPEAEIAAADGADAEMVTRYKRSFRAKIIESADAVKENYFALKNALLSYAGVNSQISWSNDRFFMAGETIARISVRGKTLCLYLDLDPAAYPASVYHQRTVGDTKQYEKMPMMVKVRSATALKRALQLVAILMERLDTVSVEREPVDYAEEFAFRSQEELIQEGLIKTSLVEKSDLDF